MFARLSQPPRLPVEAELLPTMFGDVQIRINGQDYTVTEQHAGGGIVEAVGLRRGPKEYAIVILSDGRHSCSCEDFEYSSGREERPCKHLVALHLVGLLTQHRPPHLQPSKEVPNVRTSPSSNGSAHDDAA